MTSGRTIRNPILPGFNPDPSICRVGADYYIATSTFEWYPGVQIHHSTDLVDWRLIARPLSRASQLDLRGNPDSGGVWAPCLSHADGRFWLVYTDVRRFDGAFKDAHNFLVTATDVTDDWSEPVYVNSSGFDPTLFHDDDGRKWFLNLAWNHRATSLGRSPRHSPFGGIVLQEFDPAATPREGPARAAAEGDFPSPGGALTGEPRVVFTGSARGLAEGPHVFRRRGWYYLVVAEGGTGYEHAVTHARGRTLEGPWELHPDPHVITADPANRGVLQRAGHGQTVETADGEWYHTHLAGRPLSLDDPGRRRCPLGRETSIQRLVWREDGWLEPAHGSCEPALEVPAPRSARAAASGSGSRGENRGETGSSPVDDRPRRHAFDTPALPIDFQWLRTPEPRRLFSLDARPGCLRLYGRESPGSLFEQSLVARRQQHVAYRATTTLEFVPTSFRQGAGLVAYYDACRFHVLQITHDEGLGRVLRVMSCEGDWPGLALTWRPGRPVPIDDGPIVLRCDVDGARLRFAWRRAGAADDGWRDIGGTLDASLLSDEAGRGEHASFTGAFIGMLAFDVSGGARAADFHHFDYEPC